MEAQSEEQPEDRIRVLHFFKLLVAEAGPEKYKLPLTIGVAGVGMAGLVAIINTVVERGPREGVHFELLAYFVFCSSLVILAQNRALRLSVRFCEDMLQRWRIIFSKLIRQADLDALDALGRERIYATLARDSAVLSEASFLVVHGAISGIALILTGIYVSTLSLLAFVVVAVLFSATVLAYRYSQRATRPAFVAANAAEMRFFQTFTHLLNGFKEVKMWWQRGDDLEYSHLAVQSGTVEMLKVRAMDRVNRGMVLSYSSFYLLLATVVFALPQYLDRTETAVKITFVVIFLLSTLEIILKALPMLSKADIAIESLNEIERSLSGARRDPEQSGSSEPQVFERLQIRNVVYSHHDRQGRTTFSVGPCDLEIRAGELIFIVGGNGSGKSTLLKIVSRLYEPRAGIILWDGQPVDRENIVNYRSLFATVFSDFHLFDRLYGLTDVLPETVEAMLQDHGIGDKTSFSDGAFSDLELSTGQRKRLAFVVALLEDKPIYIFDELAADQDSEFRRRYYQEILPGLKAKGKTLLVVSHDERYLDLADRVLVMEDGRFSNGGEVG